MCLILREKSDNGMISEEAKCREEGTADAETSTEHARMLG